MAAADRAGHPGAWFYLADYYYNARDYVRMEPWLDRGASLGQTGCHYWVMRYAVSTAQQGLALMRAQAPNCAEIAYSLGVAYQNGEDGLPRDFSAAETYYRMAIADSRSSGICPPGVRGPCPTQNIQVWAQENLNAMLAPSTASTSRSADYAVGRSGRICHRSEDC